MKISEQPGYRTREISLSEFLSDYMETSITPYQLEPKDEQGNIMQPLIGYLTVWNMGEFRPSMNAIFLFPDRLVYMFVYISTLLGIEPYPNPMYETIEIEGRTEYELEKNSNFVKMVIRWGSSYGFYGLSETRIEFSNGPEVDCFCRAFMLVRDHLSNKIPLPANNVLEQLGFERGYIVEESIQRFLRPDVKISTEEAIRLETAERLHRSRRQAFTKKEMEDWGYSLLRFKDYISLERIYLKESRGEFTNIGEVFYRDEVNYALYMPITNKEWAIRKADNITRGCLIATSRRLLLIDFDRKSTTSKYYEDFCGVELKDSQLTIHLPDNSSTTLFFQLKMAKKIAMQWFGIINGMTNGFGEYKENKLYNYVITKDFLERNTQSIDLSQAFAVTIYSLLVNAMEKTSA